MTAITGMVTYAAFGFGERSFEAWCPFGGMESLWGLYQAGEFSCATGPLNLSMMVGIIVLALIAKKAFCGWACPIGYLGELAARLGGIVWRKRPVVPSKANEYFKLLRYVALVVSLYFTYKMGELVLRGYDPFYLIFSGFGHGSVGMTSVIVLAVLVLAAFVVPMFFCRYLCPLGATLDPFSRVGLVKIVRNEHTCTMCNLCQKVCPQDIAPQKVRVVRARDCTNCLECVDACPVKGALELKVTV
ncbi:4Fe-4S binding protein [bacterium]|nr:4Fe-4S binding protein [bacterium]MBU1985104.1 4Fe-4S binding protein [bacterium]